MQFIQRSYLEYFKDGVSVLSVCMTYLWSTKPTYMLYHRYKTKQPNNKDAEQILVGNQSYLKDTFLAD